MTSLSYAQARVQARAGALPTESDWSKLSACSTFPQFLHVARGTGLGVWIAKVDETSDTHEIEAALRDVARSYVAEVAVWVGEDWEPAVGWVGALVDLSAARMLLGADSVPVWMRRDAALGRVALDDPDDRRRALAMSEYAPMVAEPGAPLTGAWCAHFRTLWPSASSADRDELERFIAICEEHSLAMRNAPAGDDGWRLRQRVVRALVRGFRRSTERPAAIFYHLAIAAAHWERLRGALVRRRLLPAARSEHAWV